MIIITTAMASLEFGFDRLLVDVGPVYMEVGALR